jgi:cell pole-organizing protein PopZ
MEEILASIRRILNDDEVPAAAEPAAVEPAAEEPAADEDVLVLDDTMMVSEAHAVSEPIAHEQEPDVAEPEAPALQTLEPVATHSEAELHNHAMEAPAFDTQAAAQEPPPPTPDLLGPEAAAAAASSVGSLVRTLTAGRATQVYTGGPTLEDMVRAELRPLLKTWLDSYLPPMVERLVRTEIERVVGRFVP